MCLETTTYGALFNLPHQICLPSMIEMALEKAVLPGKTIRGEAITLEIIHGATDSCREFVISSPKFSFTKWLCFTFLFNGLGYIFNLHLQVI